jgi:ABC-type uncharacterized transport system substrate-binding protein
VSGTGDGGLVEALTLRLEDFDHNKLVSTILTTETTKCLWEALIDIETRAEQECRSDGLAASEFLWQQYEELFIPRPMIESIRTRLRSDTTVVLNDRFPRALKLRTSILNRFAVYLLLKYDDSLQYIPGNIGHHGRRLIYGYRVQFSPAQKASDLQYPVRRFDDAIILHGARPERLLERHFGQDIAQSLKLRSWPSENDPTRRENWAGFFREDALSSVGRIEESRKRLNLAVLLNGNAAYAQAIALGFTRRVSALLSDTEFSVHFDIRAGLPEERADGLNQEIIENIMRQSGNPHYLITVGTDVTKFAVRNYLNKIPIICAGVTFPVESGIAKSLHGIKKNGLISGVFYAHDYTKMLEFISHLFPGKRAGFICNPKYSLDTLMLKHITQRYQIAAERLRRKGVQIIQLVPIMVDHPQLEDVGVADVYFGWYYLHLHLSEFIAQTKGSIPFVGAGVADVQRGAVATNELDDIEIGELAAEEILWRHLKTGVPLYSIPFLAPRKSTIAVNLDCARRFGINLNGDIWGDAPVLKGSLG